MPWRTALLHPTSIWHPVAYPFPPCESHIILLSALKSSDKNIMDIQTAITCVLFSKQSSRALFSQFENQKVVFSKIKWKIFFPAASKKLKAFASVCQSSIINKQPGRRHSDLQKTLSVLTIWNEGSLIIFLLYCKLGLPHRDEGSRKPVWFKN